MSELYVFTRDLDAFATKVGLAPAVVAKRVGMALLEKIVRKTPVDTGRARANWNISVNAPDRTVHDTPLLRAIHGMTTPDPASFAATHSALNRAAGLEVTPQDEIWISNNLPYIVALEHGHSQQAPAGMVMLSVFEVSAELDVLMNHALREVGL